MVIYRKIKEGYNMKTYKITLERRLSTIDKKDWVIWKKIIEIDARSEKSAWNKAEKMFASPYCKVALIEEV